MSRPARRLLRVSTLLLTTIVCWACSNPSGSKPAFSNASAEHKRADIASTAPFDYYLLSLSWAPEFCSTNTRSSQECAPNQSFGFVIHGLWPQNESGYPSGCTGPAFDPSLIPPDLLRVMPDVSLIRHEWQTHGWCTGLAQQDYYFEILKAWAAVHVPVQLQAVKQRTTLTPEQIRSAFVSANAGAAPEDFAIEDQGGRYFSEIRACLTKSLALRACSTPGDQRNVDLTILPVQ